MLSRWWKKQLRKNAKQKEKHFDAEVKKKPQVAKTLDEAVDSISDESEDATPLKVHDRKRKRKEDVPEPITEDASLSQPKKKKKNDTLDESAEDVKEDIESTVKKKYILFIGELNVCLVMYFKFADAVNVGNIPFSATVEDIIAHFQRAGYKFNQYTVE